MCKSKASTGIAVEVVMRWWWLLLLFYQRVLPPVVWVEVPVQGVRPLQEAQGTLLSKPHSYIPTVVAF